MSNGVPFRANVTNPDEWPALQARHLDRQGISAAKEDTLLQLAREHKAHVALLRETHGTTDTQLASPEFVTVSQGMGEVHNQPTTHSLATLGLETVRLAMAEMTTSLNIHRAPTSAAEKHQ